MEPLREAPVESPELLNDRIRLAQVRSLRWKQLLSTFPPVSAEIADWAVRMEAMFGPAVMVWQNVVGWIAALYIVRYGENEAYWPEIFTAEDVARALQWERDPSKTPQGVRYLRREGA